MAVFDMIVTFFFQSNAELTNVLEVPVASENTEMEISPSFRAQPFDMPVVSSNECDNVGNRTDYERNTGRSVSDELISNTDNNVSSECAVNEVVGSWNVAGHTENCDQNFNKSASRSEPDSSDSARVDKDERVSAELECDSGSQEMEAFALAGHHGNQVDSAAVTHELVSEQVDSTESGDIAMETDTVSSHVALSENNQCDSCNSETTDSLSKDMSQHGPSSVSDKVCTSSNISSSPSFVDSVSNEDSSTVQIASHVDSSTDKGCFVSESNVLEVSGSNMADDSVHTSPRVSLSLDFNSALSDNEVSNSHCEERRPSITSHSLSSRNISDSFVVSSYSNIDIIPGSNRHLKFLNENSYSTDMTVDSTTQYVSHMSAGTVNYDSDSMDVTSATEPGYQLCGDDSRRMSDDSLSSCPESSFCAESQLPKEKKKVCLGFSEVDKHIFVSKLD